VHITTFHLRDRKWQKIKKSINSSIIRPIHQFLHRNTLQNVSYVAGVLWLDVSLIEVEGDGLSWLNGRANGKVVCLSG
jgi:hypothetical protein